MKVLSSVWLLGFGALLALACWLILTVVPAVDEHASRGLIIAAIVGAIVGEALRIVSDIAQSRSLALARERAMDALKSGAAQLAKGAIDTAMTVDAVASGIPGGIPWRVGVFERVLGAGAGRLIFHDSSVGCTTNGWDERGARPSPVAVSTGHRVEVDWFVGQRGYELEIAREDPYTGYVVAFRFAVPDSVTERDSRPTGDALIDAIAGQRSILSIVQKAEHLRG